MTVISQLVSPLTDLTLPAIGCSFTNITIPEGFRAEVASLVGAVTVKAPTPTAEGSVFCVHDADGNAATNNITVSGNGNTIDGAATLVLSTNGAEAFFIFDGAEWIRVIPARRIETLNRFYKAIDAGAPLAGAGSPPTSIQLGDATAVGVSGVGARSDHQHQFPKELFSFQSINAAAQTGTFTPDPSTAYIMILRGVARQVGAAAGPAYFQRTLLVERAGAAAPVIVNENVDGDFPNGTAWTLTCTVVGLAVVFTFVGAAGVTVNCALACLDLKKAA